MISKKRVIHAAQQFCESVDVDTKKKHRCWIDNMNTSDWEKARRLTDKNRRLMPESKHRVLTSTIIEKVTY